MKKLYLSSIFLGLNLCAQVGVNTNQPTNMLHIRGNGGADPFRVEGLQQNQSNLETLVSTSTGVIKRQNFNTVSAIRVSGNLTMAINNIFYNTNATNTPVEEFDNLNEFNGNVFTASQAGLYWVAFTVTYPQRSSASDSGDGYLAYASITKSGSSQLYNNTKIYNPESGLSAANQYVRIKDVYKLNAGQTLSFQTLIYGSTNNLSGVTYKINIVRMD
ncbi:hypothetical protein ACM39_05265 [Chryseobacterium sp. FH2]|uniref:hypothetical protein n=1 Tax=Chryseobacterium sp. FH2 TaxID=1674291 RepID=UPI00065ABD98|nr:hypothetical protein [Chryseobacterium sp. FH2]KMQ68706.1 hypothetical protein ACM39_05265 [Chryseobacterium sp. FH2]